MGEKNILTIQETVARAKREGMPISEYTLRRAIRTGAVPCRIIGRTYLLAWTNVSKWLLCEDGQDNSPSKRTSDRTESHGIRRIER